jgi:predicted phosphodiesterase
MRVLIITDIHANLIALESVLKDAKNIEAVWCLGDVVGYGPNPNECIALLKEQPNLECLVGNHDAASLGLMDLSTFNTEAKQSVEWTQSQLTSESIQFLESLGEMKVIGNVTIVHGSPRQPVYEYLINVKGAKENFDYFDTDYCFVGHTHLPTLFHMNNVNKRVKLTIPSLNGETKLLSRTIINPGSVGQPRDRDPRASYAIFDTNDHLWEYNRIEYNIEGTQKRMKAVKLPERHIFRLEGGW